MRSARQASLVFQSPRPRESSSRWSAVLGRDRLAAQGDRAAVPLRSAGPRPLAAVRHGINGSADDP